MLPRWSSVRQCPSIEFKPFRRNKYDSHISPDFYNDNDNDNEIELFRHHNGNNTNIKVIFKQMTMLDKCNCI